MSERDGPALLDEEAAELRATRGALWRAEWSFEHSMWYLYNTEDPSETRWDEWLYVNREGLDNPQAAGGTRSAERSFWWNSRTGVSSWYPPKDPTRRTRACCWQRFVDKCLIACRRDVGPTPCPQRPLQPPQRRLPASTWRWRNSAPPLRAGRPPSRRPVAGPSLKRRPQIKIGPKPIASQRVMGAIVAPCGHPRVDGDDDDDDYGYDDGGREVRWVTDRVEAVLEWSGVSSPWECPRCGAIWRRQ